MNIYVSNLDFNTKDEALKTAFEEYGEVSSSKIVMDGFSGKSRGFAFVEMPNDEEGNNAIEKLNNSTLLSRTIAVQVAKPKEERKGSYPVRPGQKKY